MSVYTIIMAQGKFLHRDNLTYPFEERGLQFGDGVYEVIRIYKGKYYLFNEHVDRLYRSLDAIDIKLVQPKETLVKLLNELLTQNNMVNDGFVYLQVTRGSAERIHVYPENVEPNIYAYIKDTPRGVEQLKTGVSTITQPDDRWKHCYIKSLNLLPNIMAKQKAKEAGAYEAILHKDGVVTECGSSNIFLVKNGEIFTHPTDGSILHGCVRMAVERFANDLKIPFNEVAFTTDEIKTADELFLTSSINEILPIIEVDSQIINNGQRGEITLSLQNAYINDAEII